MKEKIRLYYNKVLGVIRSDFWRIGAILFLCLSVALGAYSYRQNQHLNDTREALSSEIVSHNETKSELTETRGTLDVCREVQVEFAELYVKTVEIFSNLGVYIFGAGDIEADLEREAGGLESLIDKGEVCDPDYRKLVRERI